MLFQIFSDYWTESFTYLSALEVTTTAAAEASSATSKRREQRPRKKAAVAGEIKRHQVDQCFTEVDDCVAGKSFW